MSKEKFVNLNISVEACVHDIRRRDELCVEVQMMLTNVNPIPKYEKRGYLRCKPNNLKAEPKDPFHGNSNTTATSQAYVLACPSDQVPH